MTQCTTVSTNRCYRVSRVASRLTRPVHEPRGGRGVETRRELQIVGVRVYSRVSTCIYIIVYRIFRIMVLDNAAPRQSISVEYVLC
jgi:hypothetical protein